MTRFVLQFWLPERIFGSDVFAKNLLELREHVKL